jgi:hypothetical protein
MFASQFSSLAQNISLRRMRSIVSPLLDFSGVSNLNCFPDVPWTIVGFVFQFIIRRKYTTWWSRYNYILSAALDASVALSVVFIFFWWVARSASCFRGIDVLPLAFNIPKTAPSAPTPFKSGGATPSITRLRTEPRSHCVRFPPLAYLALRCGRPCGVHGVCPRSVRCDVCRRSWSFLLYRT